MSYGRPVALDIRPSSPPSPSSSYEEVQHPAQYDTLPLHNMEDKTRRRLVVGGEQQSDSGWVAADATSSNYGPYTPTGPSETLWQDSDGKNVYEKSRLGIGRMPPPRIRKQPPPSSLSEFYEQNSDIIIPLIYTVLSCWTRFYKIGLSNTVVWDEAHFGKFGSYYLKRQFYFDVHPPLGKMLVGLAGLLSGYDGNYEFKSGEVYPDNVPFIPMRIMLAMFGVAMVPLAWFTSVELHLSKRACHLVTLMTLCDVAWICISKFILLDAMLLFFTFTTVFCMAKFHNQQWQSFEPDWWLWLTMTGLSIGCVASVK